MALLPTNVASGQTGHVAHTNQLHKKLNRAWIDVQADFGATGDGTTNDTTAINNAIAALPADGGTVYFPSGTYICSAATLTLVSDLRLMGDGADYAILKLADSANGRLISSTATLSNITFQGLGFDGNKANQTNGASRDDRSILFLSNITTFRVLFCRIFNGRSGAALRLNACDHTLIMGNRFHDNGWWTTTSGSHTLPQGTITVASTSTFPTSGEILVGDNQVVAYTGTTGTTFTGCTGGTGTIPAGASVIPIAGGGEHLLCDHNFNSNADHLRIIGNSYENASDTGSAQDGIQHSAIIGNTYVNNILAASISNSTTRNSRWNTITGNSIRGSSTLFRTSVGLKVSTFGNPGPGNMTDGVITGNTVHEVDRALWIEECDRMNVTGNIFADQATDAPNGQLVLMGTTGTMTDCMFRGNILYNTASRGFSFEAGTQTNITIADNNFASVTTPIGGTIPSSARIRNNRGYNPQGVTTITVTASPFTYTNNDAVPEAVYIRSGTVSNVSKNSIQIYAATNCGVWLEPGEAVTVTYSSAPTMTKDRK